MKILTAIFLWFVLQSPPSALSINAPVAFQFFQQHDSSGAIAISGALRDGYTLTAQWGDNVQAWILSSGDFSVTWADLPVGQNDLVLTAGSDSVTIPLVSVGDIYIIAGQSNAVGRGVNDQMYMNAYGLRAAMFTANTWQELADPTHLYADPRRHAGSLWPNLASWILTRGTPVAFVPLAVSGSSVTAWFPGGYLSTLVPNALGTTEARAVLWQQGETDKAQTAQWYGSRLGRTVDSWYNAYHIPTFAAVLYNNPTVKNGIIRAQATRSYLLTGAYLYDLPYDAPPHYTTDANLQEEAYRWYAALCAANFYVC